MRPIVASRARQQRHHVDSTSLGPAIAAPMSELPAYATHCSCTCVCCMFYCSTQQTCGRCATDGRCFVPTCMTPTTIAIILLMMTMMMTSVMMTITTCTGARMSLWLCWCLVNSKHRLRNWRIVFFFVWFRAIFTLHFLLMFVMMMMLMMMLLLWMLLLLLLLQVNCLQPQSWQPSVQTK